MRLRTRLALWFLLLAVVPLGAIVLYSYASSQAAFRQAVAAESRALAAEMEQRLGTTRQRLRLQITELGQAPFVPAAAGPERVAAAGLSEDAVLQEVAAKMGEVLPWVESLEFIPEAPQPPGQSPGRAGATSVLFLDHPPASPPPGAPPGQVPAPPGQVPAPPIPRDVAAEIEKARAAAREALRQGQVLSSIGEAFAGREAEKRAAGGTVDRPERAAARKRVARWQDLSPAEVQALEASRETTRDLLGEDLKCVIRTDRQVVGRVRAQVKAQALLHDVLATTPRDRGEVPFALDAGSRLYVAREGDREKLRGLPLTGGEEEAAPVSWVVASKLEPESGMRFGIARPIAGALEEMRRTAARDFGFGLGLVGLCLAGIFPLSTRISRNLEILTAGADQIAKGDLTARVPIRSRDELGRMAEAFNRMAHDLSLHQERLVEEVRRRKEQEMERRLLAAEHARQSRELEQARQFQLSLLPRELPARPDLAVAFYTRTAAEVGGDYYDFLEGEDGTLTLAIGDATGHGAAAGTMVTAVKGLFTAGAGETSPARFLAHANGVLKRMQLGRMAMALTVLRLDGKRLTLSAAGMPPVLLRRAETGAAQEIEEICLEATPLGALAACVYSEREVELAPGDTLLLLSDGLPELVGEGGEPLGYPRLHELFARAVDAVDAVDEGGGPERVIEVLVAAADAWRGAAPLGDDMTFVVLRVREGGWTDGKGVS